MDCLSVVFIIINAIAVSIAAGAAWKTYSIAKQSLKHEKFREQNRILFLKHQSEIEHVQKLIASFTEISALASSDWGDGRSHNLDEKIQDIRFHVSSLVSLKTPISDAIDHWSRDKDQNDKSIPRIVYGVLGQSHAMIGEEEQEFLKSKLVELYDIQGKLFSSMIKT